MKSKKKSKVLLNRLKKTVFLAIALCLPSFHLFGQEVADAVRMSDVSVQVEDDSLRVRFTMHVDQLNIGSQESLTLLPEIITDGPAVSLPAVVFSGKLRRKFDARKRTLSPETQNRDYRTYAVRKNETYTQEYETAIAYSSRLQAGELAVEYRYDDCCNRLWEKEDRFAYQLLLPEQTLPQVQPQIIAIRDTIVIRDTVYIRRIETLHLEYPVNRHEVYPDFGSNRTKLERLDALLDNFSGKIHLTAYASPEGPYDNNEFLALNRAESFREYLKKQYGIPNQDITTAHVTEDWEGMRKLVVANDFTGKTEALAIIDGVDIHDGREKQLTDLRGGAFWKEFLPYFRQLRRIEVEILWKDISKE
jgi:outer membrane protein OmpA-like peptidoglycan-associated protein